jgi:hypothetical protein
MTIYVYILPNLFCERKCLPYQFDKLLMYNIDSLPTANLQQTAKDLITQGFSVIPIHGNKHQANPKKPSIPWKQFQKRIASHNEITQWTTTCTAIGIVCGRVSQLMVIDFDDLYTYQNFRKHLPQYVNTFTVKTRRGYHLYYRISQHIASQKFVGGDIKAEKSYVIAPPSIIKNHTYLVCNSNERISLNPNQVDEILNYLQIPKQDSFKLISNNKSNIEPMDFIDLYDRLMQQIGRNNALYRIACIANHNALPITQIKNIIVKHHVKQPRPQDHHPESDYDRYIEAINTIKSAYSAKSINYNIVTNNTLPNSIREFFLQNQSSTIFPRLLDIFRLANWKPGRYFSMADAVSLAKDYGLNRKSIMKVLTGDLSVLSGKYIIVRRYVEYPDNRGHNYAHCGRPIEILYEVPSVQDLLRLLKIDWSPSDRITAFDVKTAHNYRLALHREYIKRFAPEVPLQWLARRLGVNVRSIQRYNQELNVQKTQNLAYFTLSKSNLDTLPKRTYKISKNATNGFWLETSTGNRYPAWRHVGSNLLKTQSQDVVVCVQKPATLSLDMQSEIIDEIVWESITPAEFLKIQAFRSCKQDQSRLAQVVDNLFQHVKKRVNRSRFYNLQLHFDSVISHIAKDDIAETITSYLFAYDRDGELVRRPAKRGIAYRMLKEFGNGNVYLALMDSHTEMFYSLARHAIKFGHPSVAMKFLMFALD